MKPATSPNNPPNDKSPHDHESKVGSYTRKLSKHILMLATLVATATYAAGFNPPGGVWQDTHHDFGHLPGDPIIRSTDHIHYQVFFYANAAAFASSLMVVVLTLLLTACHKDSQLRIAIDLPLRFLMLAGMLAFTTAYAAGACRQKSTLIFFSVLMGYASISIVFQFFLHLRVDWQGDYRIDRRAKELPEEEDHKFRKLLVPLSMFALTITYVAGLSTPGGFWDSIGGPNRAGEPILNDRLRMFFLCNTVSFVASLYGLFVVMGRKLVGRVVILYINFGLLGLCVAYIIGSSRGRQTRVYVVCGLYGAVVIYIMIHVAVAGTVMRAMQSTSLGRTILQLFSDSDSEKEDADKQRVRPTPPEDNKARQHRRASSLVQLLAGLAVGITYQAGLYPPGGLWPANADGHMAGDPILRTTNATRYKAFYYCNSVSFVASLLVILLVQRRFLHEHHTLEAAMILDLLGLIGAYAIGSCRDQVSTMYAVGLAAAAVVYVVVHVSYFTLGNTGENEGDDASVEKKGGRFLLLAILVASITYQAGLTPPGGFLLQDDEQSGHHAGDPVLLYNYPRRYTAFFYCNSVSFMVSIVLILLLVNPTHYKPAIRSHALSMCSAVSFICLMGAFAAGGTQHMKGSFYIFVLAGVAFFLCLVLLFFIYREQQKQDEPKYKPMPEPGTAKRIYLMTLGILVASVTYQSGLDQPGGSWQSSSDGHFAGHPVMHDNMRKRYLTFFYSNSTSFVASIYLISLLLLRMSWLTSSWCKMAINATLVPLCVGLLVAYASGSSRQWKTSVYVGTLVFPVLVYVAFHVLLSFWRRRSREA